MDDIQHLRLKIKISIYPPMNKIFLFDQQNMNMCIVCMYLKRSMNSLSEGNCFADILILCVCIIIFSHSQLQHITEKVCYKITCVFKQNVILTVIFFIIFSSVVTMDFLLSKRIGILKNNKKKNLFKVIILTHFVAPETVRNFFDDKIPPNDLANVLNTKKEIIKNLWKNKKHKVIKDSQLELLTGVPGVVFPFYLQPSKKKGNI